jgi:hypothetical protein
MSDTKSIKNQANPISSVFYDEDWWAFRIFMILFVAWAWMIVGFLIHEPKTVQAFLMEAWRYFLLPLIAIVGTLLLGASYIDDIYELGSYRLAIQYIWSSMFSGEKFAEMRFLFSLVVAVLFLPFIWITVHIFLLIVIDIAIFPPTIIVLLGFLIALIFSSIIFLIYRINPTPRMMIADGKEQSQQPDEINLLSHIGGPGWVNIAPGNIVVIERLEYPTDILGAGVYYIDRFRRIKPENIISLKDQHAVPRDVQAITKDGITVIVRDFQFRYRLYPTHRHSSLNRRTIQNPYPYSKQSAYKLTYNRSITKDVTPVTWEKAVQFSVDGAITEYINKNYLDTILFPRFSQEHPREVIGLGIKRRLNSLKNMYGSELIWYDIGSFDVDSTILQESIKALVSEWSGKAALAYATAEAERITNEERGRSEAQVEMFNSIVDVLNDADLPDDLDGNIWDIVLVRTAQIIDSMTEVSSIRKNENT